ncbi:hypothetical protein ACFVZM_30000 [Streptomyces sioyaensis]
MRLSLALPALTSLMLDSLAAERAGTAAAVGPMQARRRAARAS